MKADRRITPSSRPGLEAAREPKSEICLEQNGEIIRLQISESLMYNLKARAVLARVDLGEFIVRALKEACEDFVEEPENHLQDALNQTAALLEFMVYGIYHNCDAAKAAINDSELAEFMEYGIDHNCDGLSSSNLFRNGLLELKYQTFKQLERAVDDVVKMKGGAR
jgi:hypothetical protein